MTSRASILATVATAAALSPLGASPADASTPSYLCPLSTNDPSPCAAPLVGSFQGDVTPTADEGYLFGGQIGYVQVDNSSMINMSDFPISTSASVKGVGVPSTAVGDYDVIRGTPGGGWRLEVVAKNQRTTAKAACFFGGPSGKKFAVGGPDLQTLSDAWTNISCTNTGTEIQLRVNGILAKTVTVSTGAIRNPGPMLIGAKDTFGGDQFLGSVKDVEVSVP